MSPDSQEQLTQQAREGVRRVPWRAVATGALGASAIALLGAAGLAPLLAAVTLGTLPQAALAQWLASIGGNTLAGWAGDLALWAAGRPLAREAEAEAQAAQQELAAKLDALLAQDAKAAAGLARLLQAIDAVPQSLDALRGELGDQTEVLLAQHDLLTRLQADVERLGLAGGMLAPALIQEADRVIATIGARADRADAKLDQALRELRALREAQREAVSIAGSVEVMQVFHGDVSAHEIVGQKIIQQPFTPRPVAATPEERAEAAARLAALPTDAVPAPQDVLPPGFWMAQLRRNEQFVGREADLLALARLLKGGESVAVSQAPSAVASGLGGIGKTQLAIEFAYRYGQYFAGVFWLNFAQAGSVPTEIARCGGAAHLQLFTEAAGLKLDEQAAFVRSRWACGLPYLLIFDNCEDPQLVRAHHPGGAARVLITSRTPNWPGDLGVQRHRLGVLTRPESVALLHQHRPDLRDHDADALAAELGDLPLALHLAGRFLARFGRVLTPEAYLAELRSPRLFERLPLRAQDGALPTGHSRDVARTFALSYERLAPQDSEDTVALRLLARAAQLVPGEVIPAALLRATLEGDQSDLDGQLATEAALERLVGLGLLEREADDGLRMHRLVGAYVRQVSDDDTAQAAVERMVLGVAQQLTDAPPLAPVTAFQSILRGVTDAALPREDADAATLCIRLGRHLDRLGAYATAQPYLERALALRERVLGPDHPDTATSLNNLAYLYQSQGSYDAARPLYDRALALRERVRGPDHPETATSINNLAYLYQSQGNYEAARPLYERALAISERVLGLDHPQTASSLNNLAALLESQGSYDAARPLYDRALALRERLLGPDHPQTATSLNNLAALHYAQGSYDAARPLYERALAISERVLGPDHPQTATSLNNLAINYYDQDDLPAAERLMIQALRITTARLGPDHPDTQGSRQSLAAIQQRLASASRQPPSDPTATLAPLLAAIARITAGDDGPRQAVELSLAQLEQQGGMLRGPVARIWQGERERDTLVEGLDAQNTLLVERILELLRSTR